GTGRNLQSGERGIEGRIVTGILDAGAGISGGGPIAPKAGAHRGKIELERDMGEIHGNVTRAGGPSGAAPASGHLHKWNAIVAGSQPGGEAARAVWIANRARAAGERRHVPMGL